MEAEEIDETGDGTDRPSGWKRLTTTAAEKMDRGGERNQLNRRKRWVVLAAEEIGASQILWLSAPSFSSIQHRMNIKR
jgi:hypothetical protein